MGRQGRTRWSVRMKPWPGAAIALWRPVARIAAKPAPIMARFRDKTVSGTREGKPSQVAGRANVAAVADRGRGAIVAIGIGTFHCATAVSDRGYKGAWRFAAA